MSAPSTSVGGNTHGGYPTAWFLIEPDIIQDFTCAICLGVVKVAFNLPCSHLFCMVCISRLSKRECPTCRTGIPLVSMLHVNMFVVAHVQSFPIQCPSRVILDKVEDHSSGWTCDASGHSETIPQRNNRDAVINIQSCSWRGVLGLDQRNLRKHHEECNYALIDCPQKCNQQVLRLSLSHHLSNDCLRRSVQCPACCETMQYEEFVSLVHVDDFMRTSLLHNSVDQLGMSPLMSEPCKRSIRCSNVGCKTIVALQGSAFMEHQSVCEHRHMKCVVCNLPVPLSQFEQHLVDHGGASVITALVSWSLQVDHLRFVDPTNKVQKTERTTPALTTQAVAATSSSCSSVAVVQSSDLAAASSSSSVNIQVWHGLPKAEQEAWQDSRSVGDYVREITTDRCFRIDRIHRRNKNEGNQSVYVYYYYNDSNGGTRIVQVPRYQLRPAI